VARDSAQGGHGERYTHELSGGMKKRVILALTVFALALDALVTLAEKRLLKWRPAQGETEPL